MKTERTRKSGGGTPFALPLGSVGPAPVEPSATIARFEGWLITTAGLRDRFRYRYVEDSRSTHYVHNLERRAQHGESEVVRWADATVASYARTIAGLRTTAQSDETAFQHVPCESDLAELVGKSRHEWAMARREASRANGALAHRRQAQREATQKIAELEVELESVLIDAEDLRQQWKVTFGHRVARYTRARTGWLGLKASETPNFPDYTNVPNPIRTNQLVTADIQETQK